MKRAANAVVATRAVSSTDQEAAAARSRVIENFSAEDFKLPMEELPDGRLSHREAALQKQQQKRIDRSKSFLYGEQRSIRRTERSHTQGVAKDEETSQSKILKNGGSLNIGTYKRSTQALRTDRIVKSGHNELTYLKKVVGNDHGKIESLSKKTLADFLDESSFDFPKLGSLEEKHEDLRAEGIEQFCKKHGKVAAARFLNRDKRMLRKWFQELDTDHSGEVSVIELQDPMLSAGIFKTIPQIFRVMLNADKNETLGLDFEEFLNALYKNPSIDITKLKKLQDMGADEHGFNMETLITAERRAKLLNSVVSQMEKRQGEFRQVLSKLTDANRKMEMYKYNERERERERLKKARREMEEKRKREAGAMSAKGGLSTENALTVDVSSAPSEKEMRETRKFARTLAQERMKLSTSLNEMKNNMKWLEVHHETEKKLHENYTDSLETVLILKREQEDKMLESRMAKLRAAHRGEEVCDEEDRLLNAIHADRIQQHDPPVFEAYARNTNSMYGNDTRRIFMPTLIPGEEHLHPSRRKS